MAYTKQTWANGPSGGTALSAVRLQHIEDGLALVDQTLTTTVNGINGPKGKILAVGTSITFGEGASITANRWLDKLSAAIVTEFPGFPTAFTVANGGISGDTTAQMLARLEALIEANTPGIVLIETSINDARADLAIPTATTVGNIRNMVNMARMYGARPFVITSAPINAAQWITARNGGVTGTSPYQVSSERQGRINNAAVRALAADMKFEIIDLEYAFDHRVNDLADGVHPNDTGHAAWATAVARGITGKPIGHVGTMTTLVSDNFTRANSATTIGGSWFAPYAGTWGIANNKAYCVTAVDDNRVAINSGQADHNAAVTGSGLNPGDIYTVGLMFRVGDASNYYLADCAPNGDGVASVNLFKKVAGTYTTLKNVSITGIDNAARLEVSAHGSLLTVYVNAIPVIQVTDTSLTGGTGVGFRFAGGSPATRWDDLVVTL